jgi:TonB family protein
MRSTWVLVVVALAGACASTAVEERATPAAKVETARPLDPGWRPGNMPIKVGDEPSGDDMAVEGGRGTLEQREVDAVLGRHVKELVACAEQAGPARRYVSGTVALRFFVTSQGQVSNVLVVASSVGNFAVERCLVEQGRRISLPRPKGHKSTDFQYTLQFMEGDRPVVDWTGEKVARTVAQLSPRLESCGALGPAPVKAVLYIEPGGSVGSVGLASDSPLDVEAASCAVDQIRRWRLRDDRRHVVRTSFSVGGSDPEHSAELETKTPPARGTEGRSANPRRSPRRRGR